MYERLPWASGFSTLSASVVHPVQTDEHFIINFIVFSFKSSWFTPVSSKYIFTKMYQHAGYSPVATGTKMPLLHESRKRAK